MIFYLPEPLNLLLVIIMEYSWQLLCAQHKSLFDKYYLEKG